MKVKGFAWAGLATEDFERSLRFFTEVLGLPVEVQTDDVAILTVGPGQQLEIFGGDHPGKRLTANPVIAFSSGCSVRSPTLSGVKVTRPPPAPGARGGRGS